MNLSVLVFIASVAASMALTPQQLEKMRQIRLPCLQAAGLTEEDHAKFRQDRNLLNDPKVKKHLACIFKKVGYITETGDVNPEQLKTRLKTVVSEEEADQVVKKCLVKKENPEETGYNLMLCLKDNYHGPGFSPVD